MRPVILLVVILVVILAAGCDSGGSPSPSQDTKSDISGSDVASDTGSPGIDQACVPQCEGKECGDDGCGGSCGVCPDSAPICDEQGKCQLDCTPDCDEKECGPDGCGGTCGTCPDVAPICDEDGKCQPDCTPDCDEKECGSDGCGGTCGTCPDAAPICDSEGKCQEDCTPDCDGKECGSDGCGDTCGTCPDVAPLCDEDGKCQPDCTPDCDEKECGPDGCGGTCGECDDGYDCNLDGQCTADCELLCSEKECGSSGIDDECDCGQCDDSDICTDDSCVEGLCVFTYNSSPCDDDDPCTINDGCLEGACLGLAKECDDLNQCTMDSCNPGSGDCVSDDSAMDGTDCDDGNPCTELDLCSQGVCVGAPLSIEEVLDAGCICVDDEDCIALDDEDVCNGVLQCDPALLVCVVDLNSVLDCNDSIDCTVDSCHETEGCLHEPNQALCNDGFDCTQDSCDALEGCINAPQPSLCDDENVCTIDDCVPGAGCTNTELDNGTSCADDSHWVCNEGECVCQGDCTGLDCGGDGCGGSCGTCPDGPECTTVACSEGLCEYAVGPYSCLIEGECISSGTQSTENDCLYCAPASSQSGWTLKEDEVPCGNDPQWFCFSGVCECAPDCLGKECGDDGCGGSCGDCDDQLSCTVDSCDSTSCVHEIESESCVIGGYCVPLGTQNPQNPCQTCSPQLVQTGWIDVDNGTPCGTGKVCFEGTCCNYAANCMGKQCGPDGCGGSCGDCDDENVCNGLETCGGDGICLSGDVLDCEDSNPCTDDDCDPIEGCVYENNAAPCDDGNPCSGDGQCQEGQCLPSGEPECGFSEVCNDGECFETEIDNRLSIGDSFACAIAADGGVRCWGYNVFGAIGNGTFDTTPTCRCLASIPMFKADYTGQGVRCEELFEGDEQ